MEFEKSRLERLKRSLYSRDESKIPKERRSSVPEREYDDVKNNWGDPPSFDLSPDVMIKKNNSFFNKFLLISVVFFIVAFGVASFIFFGGLNTISSNNVDIKIEGPATISSGEELDASLTIVNNNRANLENVNLYIDYPDGTQSLVDTGKALSHDKINLDTLAKGESKDQSIRAIFFGEKGKVMPIKLTLEYTTSGSSAVFSKEKTYEITIGSSPILLNLSYPKEINSGQDVSISIDVTSNSSAVIQNVLLKVSYPYGFTYKSSNINPINKDNTIWSVGDLKGGDKKTLTITGTLVGQNQEDRSFNVSAGTGDSDTSKDFTTSLALDQATVGIRKSFFDLALSSSNDVQELGKSAPISIDWSNTLPDKIVDSSIVAKMSGNVFNPSMVNSNGNGFYRSVDSTITWDKNTSSNLAELNPGEEGNVSFSLTSLPNSVQTRSIKNPHIDINVTMQGNKTGSDTSNVVSTADMTLKFISDLELSAKSYRNVGPFSNTGPIPPRADIETTYTVTWTMTNTSNDLKNTIVSAVLPVNIVWKGETSPSSERITYSSDSRTISWNVGNMLAGTGFTNSPKTVSFKVSVTPSVTQVGQALDLVSNISAVATDTYAEQTIHASAGNVSTRFSDTNFGNGDDLVTR